MPMLPVILAGAKPSDIEGLSSRIGELIGAIMNAVAWMHRGEGFLACLTMVVLTLVFGSAFAVVTWLLTRNRGDR